MSLDADAIVDRRRMRRKLTFWRVTAVVVALVAIGGDDTLSYALRLHDENVPVIAIPKTMDNDVRNTEYCIGFSTAITRASDAIQRQRTTVASHERIGIFRIFGVGNGDGDARRHAMIVALCWSMVRAADRRDRSVRRRSHGLRTTTCGVSLARYHRCERPDDRGP